MLKIEIKEKGSESFYREVVNFQAQYRFILRNPARKLKDYFKQFRTLLILGSVFLVALIFMSIFWGASTLDYAIMAALAIAMAMCLAYLHMLGKALKTLMNDSRSSVLILDDSGVELNKEDSQIVKLAWSNISFIRLYWNSTKKTPKLLSWHGQTFPLFASMLTVSHLSLLIKPASSFR